MIRYKTFGREANYEPGHPLRLTTLSEKDSSKAVESYAKKVLDYYRKTGKVKGSKKS